MCQKAVTWYMKAYARDCDFVFAPSRDMESGIWKEKMWMFRL